MTKSVKLQFLGSCGALTIDKSNYHSNMLLSVDNKNHFMLDCGSDIRFSLHDSSYTHYDVRDVYISHLHADHVGGLEWLAFTTKFDPNYVDKPILHIHDSMTEDLWNKVLSGGLSSLQGEISCLETYFDVQSYKNNESIHWQNLELFLVQTVHYMSGFALAPSFGLLFEAFGKQIFITTDLIFCPHLYMPFYQKADIIFHDCSTSPHPGGIHAHYQELLTLPEEIRKKMWLFHYDSNNVPDAQNDGFRGFVTRGQCFDFADDSSL